jgi:hypothetical protein
LHPFRYQKAILGLGHTLNTKGLAAVLAQTTVYVVLDEAPMVHSVLRRFLADVPHSDFKLLQHV